MIIRKARIEDAPSMSEMFTISWRETYAGLLLPETMDAYLRASYRITTAPDSNSKRSTSRNSIGFESPANSVGPWPASLGCTTNSYSSINPSSASNSKYGLS